MHRYRLVYNFEDEEKVPSRPPETRRKPRPTPVAALREVYGDRFLGTLINNVQEDAPCTFRSERYQKSFLAGLEGREVTLGDAPGPRTHDKKPRPKVRLYLGVEGMVTVVPSHKLEMSTLELACMAEAWVREKTRKNQR